MSLVAPPPTRRGFVPPPLPATPKAAGTRRHLLTVAAELFVARGYHAVSTRDIAAAAGLTKGALYGHFSSKGQLLVEVIRWKITELDEAIDYAAAMAEPRRGVELIYQPAGRETRLLEVDAAAAARHDPDVAAGLDDLYSQRHARIRDAAAEVDDPDVAAWLIEVLSAGIGMKEAAGAPMPDATRLSATLLAALRGLGTDGGR
jgi:AcrR family transcriptional regulator